MEPVEVAHRLWEPVQQYAMIENALRAAEGRTLAQHRSEVATLWARFNRVARTNPEAAFPEPMEAGADRVGVTLQPPAGLPLQQVALHPVDGEPGGGTVVLFGRDRRPPRCAHRPPGRPPGGAGVQPCRLPVARDRPPTRGRPWRSSARRPRSGSGGRWPRSRRWSSTAASPPPSGCSSGPWVSTRLHAHRHRGDGVRRRAVQQLRPAVDGDRSSMPSAPNPARSGW